MKCKTCGDSRSSIPKFNNKYGIYCMNIAACNRRKAKVNAVKRAAEAFIKREKEAYKAS